MSKLRPQVSPDSAIHRLSIVFWYDAPRAAAKKLLCALLWERLLPLLSFLMLVCLISGFAPKAQAASENDVRTLEEQESDRLDPLPNEEPVAEPRPALKSPGAPSNHPPLLVDPEIRPIEAEEFRVKIIKTSRSKKVLLLEDPNGNEPRPGKILLLKGPSDDIAAVRVLKNYPGKIATKIVLKFSEFAMNTEYRALKKLSDKILEQIRKRQAMGLDEGITDDDLAKEIDPNDVELDRGIPTPEKKKSKKKGVKDEDANPLNLELNEDELSDSISDFSHIEDANIEPQNHVLSMQLALLSNVDAQGAGTRYTGAGLRYGYNFGRRLMFDKPTNQDMLTLEMGAFFYKIVGFSTADDEINVIPLVFTLRYNLMLTEYITAFLYAGVIKNNASVASGTVKDGIAGLSRTRAAAGGGFLIRIGPGWSLRGDLGLDMIAFGAALRF